MINLCYGLFSEYYSFFWRKKTSMFLLGSISAAHLGLVYIFLWKRHILPGVCGRSMHGLLSETAAGKQAYIFIDIDTKSNWLSVTLINTCYMSLFRFTSSSGVATNSSLLSSRSAVASMASSSSKSFGSLPRTPPWLAWKKYIYILQLHLIMIHYLYNNLSDMKLLFTF